MTKTNRVVFGTIFCALLVGGFLLAVKALSVAPERGPAAATPTTSAPETPEADPNVSALSRGSLARYARQGRQVKTRPASLEGTRVDGELTTDDAGNLKLTRDVRRVFEYFLATVGEVTPEAASALLASYIESQLPPKAASQTWDLFIRYLDMKEAMSEIPAHDGTEGNMRAVLAQRQSVREGVLGQKASDAFFGMDNQYNDYMMSRQTLRENTDLSAAERQQRLDQLRKNAPQRIRSLLTQPDSPTNVGQAVASMRKDGASEQAIQTYRTEKLGPEAAGRLQNLDQQRDQWQQQYNQYLEERQAILNSGMAEPDRQEAIEQLQERKFNKQQIRRAEALDRIRAREGKSG